MLTRILFFALVIILGGCNKKPTTEHRASPPEANTSAKDSIDVANLLTNDEIQSIVGEELKEPTSSTRSDAGFVTSQCYFAVTDPAKSIVLTVTSRGSEQNARDPRAFWMEKFHGEKKEEEENEHKQAPPQRVDGLGDEAYWLGSGGTGALYVLQAEKFIRVAVGGTDDDATRISKCRKLAEIALKRL